MSNVIKLKPGELLILEGDKEEDLFWVQKGELSVIQKRPTFEIILDHVKAGELIGELSLIDKKPRSATIKAISDCELVRYSGDEMKQILEAQPQIVQTLLKTLVERLRKTTAKVK